MNKKYLVIGLIILLLAGIVGGFMFFKKPLNNEQNILWSVPQNDIKDEDKSRILQGMYENQTISNIDAIEKRKEANSLLSVEKIDQDGNYIWASVAIRDSQTKEIRPSGATGFLGKKTNGEWKIAFPGEKEFIEWLPNVPESIMSKESKDYFDEFYGGAQ